MKSTRKNILYNFVYQLLIIALPFLTTPYVARVIGSDGIGIYNYTYSIAYLCYLFGVLGLNNYGNRSIASVSDNKQDLSKMFWSIYFMQLSTAMVAIVVYIIFIINSHSSYRFIIIIQFVYVCSAALDINWFFFGMQEFKLTIIRNTLVKLMSFILIFALVKDKGDLPIYTAILSISALITQILMWFFLKGRVVWVKPTTAEIKAHLLPNIKLFIPIVAVSVYTYLDKIMLGMMSSMTQTGYYSNAEKIIQVPISLVNALSVVMLPRITNLISNSREDIVSEYNKKTIKLSMIIATAFGLGIAAIAPDFTMSYLGPDYRACIPMIEILAIDVIFIGWASVIRTQYLIPRKKDNIYIMSAILGAVSNVIVNLIAIPHIHAMGAVFGTVAAEFTVAFYQTYKVRKDLPIKEYLKSIYVYVIIGIVMVISVRVFSKIVKIDSLILLIFNEILVGGVIFVTLSVIYMYLNDRQLFDKYIRRSAR